MQKVLLPLLFIAFAHGAFAQDSLPKPNEQAILIQSKALGEGRSIWVHLPDDYYQCQQTYPVLYVLDGDGPFGEASAVTGYLAGYDRNRIPPMIVVAIVNIDRTRDFTPIHSLEFGGRQDSARLGTSGGGGRFLQFIQQELVPHIDSSFRTQPYRVLAAHSLGGLFGLYAFQQAPGLFNATILMSPAFYGGNNQIFTAFTPFLKSHPALKSKLFITIGDEDTHKVDSLRLQLTNSAPKTLAWGYRQYTGENHFSVTYKSLYDGLRFIYKNWFIDFYDGSKEMWFRDLQAHFTRLSDDLGYAVPIAEELANNCGYTQLRGGHIDCAIDIFVQNTLHHPTSWNAFDSLGEAYAAKGDKQKAIENYEKSVQLNPHSEGGLQMLKKLKGE